MQYQGQARQLRRWIAIDPANVVRVNAGGALRDVMRVDDDSLLRRRSVGDKCESFVRFAFADVIGMDEVELKARIAHYDGCGDVALEWNVGLIGRGVRRVNCDAERVRAGAQRFQSPFCRAFRLCHEECRAGRFVGDRHRLSNRDWRRDFGHAHRER